MSNLDTLARLAKADPTTISPDGRARLEAAGYGDLFAKAVSYPPLSDPAWGGWMSAPGGYMVYGPGSTDAINAARGAATGSSAVWAALNTYTRHYVEPPLAYWRGPRGDVERSEAIEVAPVLDLIASPSAWWTMRDLDAWRVKTILIDGTAYLLKLRDGGGTVSDNVTGRVVGLWPMGPHQLRPWRDMDAVRRGEAVPLVQEYRYEIDGRKVRVPIENVMVFRDGIDPVDPALGVGVVRQVAREVGTDIEATVMVDTLLRNMGIPGLVFAPKDASRGGMDTDAIKSYIMATTTGGRRGQPIVFKQPTDFYQMGISQGALDLSAVWRHLEARITGALGVPAILAGLEVGLDNANYAQARALQEFFVESTLMAAWARDSERWTLGLAADFGFKADEWLGYNTATVRALATDRDALWSRTIAAWDKNAITLETLYTMLDIEDPIPPAMAGMRKVDIEAGATTAPPAATGGAVIDVSARPAPMLPTAPKAALGAPEAPKADDGIAKAARVTEADVDAAIVDWDAWAADNAPQFVGILGDAGGDSGGGE